MLKRLVTADVEPSGKNLNVSDILPHETIPAKLLTISSAYTVLVIVLVFTSNQYVRI